MSVQSVTVSAQSAARATAAASSRNSSAARMVESADGDWMGTINERICVCVRNDVALPPVCWLCGARGEP
jgi:hypothetical protein